MSTRVRHLMGDGRGLVALGLLTLLGAAVAHGSRGVVRTGRGARITAFRYRTWQGRDTRVFKVYLPRDLAPTQRQLYQPRDLAPTEQEPYRQAVQKLAKDFASAVNEDLVSEGRSEIFTKIWPPEFVWGSQGPVWESEGLDGIQVEVDMSEYPDEIPFGPAVAGVFTNNQVEVLD